ncbi:MAG TPA: DNA polymerase Y family protein, partial [Ohtaekwangia sp.]
MAVADARVFTQDLTILDDKPDLLEKLLPRLAEWCIRFSPIVAVDMPDGLLIDASGCTHLWGGDQAYLEDISKKLSARGYEVRLAIADTIGAAWGIARFGSEPIVSSGRHIDA